VVFLFFAFRPLNKVIELITLLSINIVGIVFAIRHVLIQKKIIEIPAECGIDLEYMFDNFPLQQVFELVFRGTGDCSEIDWTLLNLTIPEWSAIWFLIFAILSIFNFRNN
jgi:disulfide bond formation protein DsbB|tara:strand:- start:289 stop:618 length:330 start_codon:yes stop_codon:yes gene_type:complete